MLREKYPLFLYRSSSCRVSRAELELSFDYLVEPDIAFEPKIRFVLPEDLRLQPSPCFAPFAFYVGSVELFSYWKATCSQNIRFESGFLTPALRVLLEELMFRGMGEFFFRNAIDYRGDDFVAFSSSKGAPRHQLSLGDAGSRVVENLLMFSGGKDSLLSAILLKDLGIDFHCISLNPSGRTRELLAQLRPEGGVTIERKIDARLLVLNELGYLNGHTPFSALLAAYSTFCAFALGATSVIASNESTCDRPNASYLGDEINHEFSKSSVFERSYNDFLREEFSSSARYYSLIRPLNELQVVCLFSGYREYLNSFVSCNRRRGESWCGCCSKCISVFALFYPFVGPQLCSEIFGGNLFCDEGNWALLSDLLGGAEYRPFECVATEEELLVALYLSLRLYEKGDLSLPSLLKRAKDEYLEAKGLSLCFARELLLSWNETHSVPQEIAAAIRVKLIEAVDRSFASWS